MTSNSHAIFIDSYYCIHMNLGCTANPKLRHTQRQLAQVKSEICHMPDPFQVWPPSMATHTKSLAGGQQRIPLPPTTWNLYRWQKFFSRLGYVFPSLVFRKFCISTPLIDYPHPSPSFVLSKSSLARIPPRLVPVMFDQTFLFVPGIGSGACLRWNLVAAARCLAEERNHRHQL